MENSDKPSQGTDIGPIVAGSVTSRSRKKVFLLVAVALVVVAIAYLAIDSRKPSQGDNSTDITSDNTPPGFEFGAASVGEVERARQTVTANGVLQSISQAEIVIVLDDELGTNLELQVIDETEYQQGPDYFTSSREYMRSGRQTLVVYNQATKELYAIWQD